MAEMDDWLELLANQRSAHQGPAVAAVNPFDEAPPHQQVASPALQAKAMPDMQATMPMAPGRREPAAELASPDVFGPSNPHVDIRALLQKLGGIDSNTLQALDRPRRRRASYLDQ